MYLVNIRTEAIEEVELVEIKKGCGTTISKGNELWFIPTEDSDCFLCSDYEQAKENLYIRKHNLGNFVPQ